MWTVFDDIIRLDSILIKIDQISMIPSHVPSRSENPPILFDLVCQTSSKYGNTWRREETFRGWQRTVLHSQARGSSGSPCWYCLSMSGMRSQKNSLLFLAVLRHTMTTTSRAWRMPVEICRYTQCITRTALGRAHTSATAAGVAKLLLLNERRVIHVIPCGVCCRCPQYRT